MVLRIAEVEVVYGADLWRNVVVAGPIAFRLVIAIKFGETTVIG